MKELELEIGVAYQPRSYESVTVNLRVALEEGEDAEKVSQECRLRVKSQLLSQEQDTNL
ncbi:MAG: hypothetical protein AB4063_03440 [Crocosphaera sp.]